MPRPIVVAHHTRSGLAALNVVTAALQTKRRTDAVEVRFARDRDELVRELRAAGAAGALPIALWSFYSPDFLASAADLAWVRERSTALHVAGGVHATAEPHATLRAGFDLVAVGEGESTIVALLEAFLDGAEARSVRGIAHLAEGRLRSNGPGERRPLDDFPAFNARAGKWNALEITRGCVYACSFCQTPFMFKARFRHRSVANVREHIARMRVDGTVRYARFLTPTCLSYGSADESVNLAAVEELLAAVREELPQGRIYFGTFPSECRPEHVTFAALRVLKRYVDNRQLVIGGQSGSDRVLRAAHRGHCVEDVRRAVHVSLQAGFVPDVDFLLGLPGETAEDRAASIAFARELAALGTRIHSHSFMPLPGTPLAGSRPEPIEEPTLRAMEQLESQGALHGQWRRQARVAEQLVALRSSHGTG
ncbi:MAG TPA: TIGR04013 family B12-binding domain/radical SAM domain-containing protein [Myxococcales bacterium]|nr:TIGR04013 family B12-binding domain/radical SAM domain-containing protein [Myxococcales bacterium]